MVTNRVYKVLVTNGTEAGSLGTLAPGQYIVLKKGGEKISALTPLSPEDEFQIVVGTPDGSRLASDLIRIKDITSYEERPYRAKVEQTVSVTMGTPTEGVNYSISIEDKSDKEILQHRMNRRTYSVIAAPGETSASLATKFAARINGDPNAIVTAVGVNDIVTLQAKSIASVTNAVGEFTQQYTFNVVANAATQNWFYTVSKFGDISTTSQPDFGSGNFWQVRQLEQRASGYTTGITNKTLFPVGDPLYNAVVGTNYDILVLNNEDEHDTNVVSMGKFKAPISTFIAVTDGADDTLATILRAIVAVK